MSAFADGKYRIARGGPWLGKDPMLVEGDEVTISGERPGSLGLSVADLTIRTGHLSGYTGELAYHSGASRALGRLASPAGIPEVHYRVAAEVIGIANGRSLRLVLIRIAGISAMVDEEESGGEWEGDEEPCARADPRRAWAQSACKRPRLS